MADDWKEIVSKLIDKVPVLVLLLGVSFVVLGLSKGAKYVPIVETPARVVSGVFGVCLCVTGLWLLRTQNILPKADAYGIKIQAPAEGDIVHIVDVSGTIKKTRLPTDYTLEVFRLYSADAFIPVGRAYIDKENKTWKASQCDVGGTPKQKREIAAFLVGPAGTALIEYQKMVTKAHRIALDQLTDCGKQARNVLQT